MSHDRNEMSALYDQYDANGDGNVSVQELRNGMEKMMKGKKFENSTVIAIFNGLDMDGDKSVTKDEFLDQMCGKICRRVGFTNQFKELDSDNSGYLSPAEVRPLLQSNDFSDDQIEQMFKDCDCNSDGKITCEEFLKLM